MYCDSGVVEEECQILSRAGILYLRRQRGLSRNEQSASRKGKDFLLPPLQKGYGDDPRPDYRRVVAVKVEASDLQGLRGIEAGDGS